MSEPLASEAGRALVNGWFVQIALPVFGRRGGVPFSMDMSWRKWTLVRETGMMGT